MFLLKQSTAATVMIGPFIDDGDGKTAETGLTISQADVRLSKNGANIAQKNESSAATHDELGYYDCDLDTTDTGTLGRLKLMVHESGALPVWHEFMVVPANVYDSLVGGSDNLEADVKAISGDETAADNAEAFFDGTGYAGTNNVIPTVSALTGHTAQTGDNYARIGAPAGASVSSDIAALPTAGENADQVWDEALAGHSTGGTAGKQLTDVALTDELISAASIRAEIDSNSTQLTAIVADTGALNDTALPDSVPADGSLPTLKQAVYMINQFLTERAVSGTTVTVKKVDGSTSLMTFTLDSGSAPTSITRAS